MATVRWLPTQRYTKQVDTITFTADDPATTYKFTINGKVVSIIGQGTVTLDGSAMLTALNAALAQAPEFSEIAWANPSAGVITGTAVTAGTPFTLTTSVTGGAGTLSQVHTTANQSPSDVNDGLNWLRGGSYGTLPQAADDLIDDTPNVPSMLWNLGSLSAITLTTYTRRVSAAGHGSGLPEWNPNGYAEYRPTEFAISATTRTIELAANDAPAGLKFNAGSVQETVIIRGQFSGANQLGSEKVWWRGTHASNVLSLENASVAVAPVNANAATILTLNANSSTVRMGSGLTGPTTINNAKSTIEANATFTTLNQKERNSNTYVKGAAAVTTPNINGGTLWWQSTGSPGTPSIGSQGAIDFSTDNRARSLGGNVTVAKGATWNDPDGTVAAVVTFVPIEGTDVFADCNIVVGPGRNATVAT